MQKQSYLEHILRQCLGNALSSGWTENNILQFTDHAPAQCTSSNQRDDQLVAMSWNVAYGRGSNSDNRVNKPGTKKEIQGRLEKIGAYIQNLGADLVLLQEIDFAAKRSHAIDQLSTIAEASDLKFAAPCVSWKARYVPYPYWPPNRHYGKVRSGGAVLSRHPITANRCFLHEMPAHNPWWYNAFYLFRYSQFVTIQRGSAADTLHIVNNHLEAFSKGNRIDQMRVLRTLLSGIQPAIVGGDFNTLPPEASQRSHFEDDPGDDYCGDYSLDLLRSLPGLRDCLSPNEYAAREAAYFTFPSKKPTRRLDHFLHSTNFTCHSTFVPEIDDVSDHRPIVATLQPIVATSST